ncbi:hypothetical protein B0T18DRAFT_390197 [Schizothecium vesticola]|uniref:Secreted protein n=1 Tax=Schizothecium vesticola TaxID=314040 RepID=A0AA40EU42_9PEZI|nr:hypothetical protein B0T18DRAFT_390197 [Schizothecium vesticola]
MKFFHFLALPALAAAAVMVERQTAGGVQVVTAHSISNGQGSGCPESHFGVLQKGDYITLKFDMYRAELYPTNRSDISNLFCDYEVTLRFPEGCTSGIVDAIPRGAIRLQRGFQSQFESTYVLSPGPGRGIEHKTGYKSDSYDAPEREWADWMKVHPVPVTAQVASGGQRDFTFTARSRLFLVAPSFSPDESASFSMDSLDIKVRDMVTSKC